jgi:hypothetical protein
MSKTIDKSLTKKLLDDVIVKDEPEVDVYKSTYQEDARFKPEPSYVEGAQVRSWMDDCDLGLGFVGLGKDYTSARAVVDGNRSGGKVIELDRHDTDEIIRLLAKKMENVLQKEGFVMTPDSRDELENSLLAVVDLCKWKSETSLYVLKLR